MGEGILIRGVWRILGAGLVAAALAACGPVMPSATDAGASKASPAGSPSTSVAPSPSPAADLPGRPYDGATLLALMRAQRQPALDASLVREDVANAMAQQVWTYDGMPYQATLFEAACEGPTCTVGLTGLPAFATDPTFADTYRWVLDPGSAALQPEGAWPSLSGYPHELDAELAAEAQRLDTDGRLDGLQLSSARWVSDAGRRTFQLQFDDGLDPASGVSVLLNRTDQVLEPVAR